MVLTVPHAQGWGVVGRNMDETSLGSGYDGYARDWDGGGRSVDVTLPVHA